MKAPISRFIYGRFFSNLTKDGLSRQERKKVLEEYNRIFDRAKDIGSANSLLSCYAMAAFFIAMNRTGNRSPQENYDIFAARYSRSKVIKLTFGTADSYLAPKRIAKQQKWSAETHLRRYENDWEVDVLPGCADYDLGYDYTGCGICKLCVDEGCPELAKYLCKLDYIMADMMGLQLIRTKTLADGDELCDFRFKRL